MAEIARVNPGVIATLGNVPLQAVTDSRLTIGEAHGKLMAAGETGRPLFALYHPASLIYNRSLAPCMNRMCARWPKFCAKACFKAAKCIIETKGLSFPANL